MNIEELLADMRGKLTAEGFYLLLENHSGRFLDNTSNNVRDMADIAWSVVREAKKGDFEDENLALQECKIIMFQIIGKMIEDKKNYETLQGLDVNTISYDALIAIKGNHFGWRCQHQMHDSPLQLCHQYNKADWRE